MSFFSQPCRPYRDFALAYAVLTANFLVPAVVYLFAPELAYAQLDQLADLLGWASFTGPERDSEYWRFLGFSNVFSLGFMCGLLLLNLRRFFVVLLPLAVLKGASVFGAGWLWIAGSGHPFYALAAGFDGLTVFAMLYFARRAFAALPPGDEELVPRPRFVAP